MHHWLLLDGFFFNEDPELLIEVFEDVDDLFVDFLVKVVFLDVCHQELQVFLKGCVIIDVNVID